jgi:hypothetical protein
MSAVCRLREHAALRMFFTRSRREPASLVKAVN